MKHSRPDYNRIQDPAGNPELLVAYRDAVDWLDSPDARSEPETPAGAHLMRLLAALRTQMDLALNLAHTAIPADEPVFLLRAQDMSAATAVRQWAFIHSRNGGNSDMARDAIDQAERMEAWQRERGTKPAEMPPEKTHPLVR